MGIASIAWLLAACGEEENGLTNVLEQPFGCETLDGHSFYSESLGVGGETLEGTNYNYWQVSFQDGVMTAFYTDVASVAYYHCEDDGQVALSNSSMGTNLVFSEDWQELYFNPHRGEPLTYRRHAPEMAQVSRCNEVSGNRYAIANDTPVTNDKVAIPTESPFFEFGDGTSVEFGLGDGGTQMGYYSCQLGTLRVHRDVNDVDPIEMLVQADGRLRWLREESDWVFEQHSGTWRPIGGDPVACIDIYDPVCGVIPDRVQCITTPCPVGFYQTFSNSCYANVQRATVIFGDACGSLEGELYYEEEPSCDGDYDPVCGAAVDIAPCHEAPCPATVHTTFSNACVAEMSAAPVLFQGECGDAEGIRVTELEGACPAIWDPVCGLSSQSEIICVTEPCPTHEYRTFGNACAAGLSLASVVFEGECGALENTLTMGEPPIQLTSKLPETEKTLSIGNAAIEDDILIIEVGYSGCSPQHFDMHFSPKFGESYPVQAAYSLTPQVEDLCRAAFQTEFTYDLRPLKHAYQEAYQTENGAIYLPGIGTYRF